MFMVVFSIVFRWKKTKYFTNYIEEIKVKIDNGSAEKIMFPG